jgi:two-component system chemotaxis sensor kinase CheA
MAELDDLVKEFLVESYENLDRLDQDFLALEKDAADRERLSSIFRTIHTIKGTCGFLGLHKLEGVTHVGESLLSRLRDGEMTATSEIVSGLLAMVDAVREILGSIETTASEGNGDYTKIIENLTRLKENRAAGATPAAPAAPAAAAVKPPAASGSTQSTATATTTAVTTTATATTATAPAGTPAGHESESPVDSAVHPQAQISAEPAKAAVPAAPESGKSTESSSSNSGIRVDVGLLDRLMNLVGELVLARNQILQFSATVESATLAGSTQRLNLITSELQEGVMKTRMQPIGNVWSKFPRIVRDLSQICGKKIRVEMEGKETELDKTIIEAIKDPLTHIIRNSVDHGIESSEKRLAAGKDAEGRLFLRAFHEGGQVNIEIIDDGGGVHLDRVRAKAIERGLITVEQAAKMSEREVVNLIFLPGFSTAEKITNVSGRGVGMDVVKTNIEKIGGTVDLQSKFGQGTTLRIRIPLTLAIIPALVVTSGGERFAIPQVSLLELLRLDGDESKIETIHGAPIYRLRGSLLPLVYLNRLLNLPPNNAKAGQSSNIVVLSAAEHQFGLVVDQVNDTEEIVVKPLSKQLKGISVFSGATIMGDGRVALILDVVGVAHKANAVSQATTQPVQQSAEANKAVETNHQTLLLMMLRNGRRMAIPLDLVSRLEEFKPGALEQAGKHQVVQYRGQIMPLINLADAVAERRSKPRPAGAVKKPVEQETDSIQVVVFEHEKRSIGLRVERIMDVVDEEVLLQNTGTRLGVRGTAVIKEKVTEVIDLEAIVAGANLSNVNLAA